MSTHTPPHHQDDEIDLGRLLGLLVHGKWWIAGITAAALSMGVAYALLATPVYRANALLQIEEKSNGMAALGDATEMFSQKSSADTEIELIRSRMVLGAAIDERKRDIVVQPNYFPLLGRFVASHYQGEQPASASLLKGYAWGGEQINISQLRVPAELVDQTLTLQATEGGYALYDEDNTLLLTGAPGRLAQGSGIELLVTDLVAHPGTGFTLTKASRLNAINTLAKNLSVSERGKASGILSLSLTGINKADIVGTLNAVAQQYLLQNIQRMSAEAEKSLEFLARQQPELKQKLDEAEERLNRYRQQNKSVDLGLETQSVLTQIVDLEKQLNELSFKESELSRLYTRAHPSYQALLEKKRALSKDKQRLSEQVEHLPETQQEVLRLTRDVQVSQEIYIQLLNKVQELNIVKAGTVGNVRIIDEAVAEPEAVKPKKPLIVALATILGAMFGTGMVLVRGLLNRGVENPEDFEQAGMSVYASVPLSETHRKKSLSLLKRKTTLQQGSLLLAAYNPTDLAIESLRALRTSLHFAMMEASNNVLAIGGPSPAVGKSFVSTNLGAICAQAGQKVLVIDADLRKGYLHTLFNAGNTGLSELLSGQQTLQNVVQPTEVNGLNFIARGQVPPNPSELLMHANFKKLLDEVSSQYDLVLIDTPPILAVTDPAIVSALAGTTLMVTRYAQNPLKEVEVATRRYQQNNIQVKGIIFNAVEHKSAAYGYGNYGYYNYEYKSS